MGPRWPQDGLAPSWPKMAQDGPKMAQDGPSWPQVGPKMGQDGPSWPQDGLKMASRLPKMAQDGLSWPQDGPKMAQVGFQMGAGEAQELLEDLCLHLCWSGGLLVILRPLSGLLGGLCPS